MPKRIGFLYEQAIEPSNCISAVYKTAKFKKNLKVKNYLVSHVKSLSDKIIDMLINDSWEPSPFREMVIFDSHRGKYRNIKIPCIVDQLMHHAVMNVTEDILMKHNYFYNCGSIPRAGMLRASKALCKWLGKRSPYKYCDTMDIKKFYEHVRHIDVVNALKKLIKDPRIIKLHEKILKSMSSNGIGLAIGFYPSAWYANLVLNEIDTAIMENNHGEVKMVRYMDDRVILSKKRRTIRRVHEMVVAMLTRLKLILKHTWQIFNTNIRSVDFLSYRYYHGFSLMKKKLMYRISKHLRTFKQLTLHEASSLVSHIGILKHCNSYNFKISRVYPYVIPQDLRAFISRETKRLNLENKLLLQSA